MQSPIIDFTSSELKHLEKQNKINFQDSKN